MSKEHSHKWYRDKMTHLEQLLADESHYAPYSDVELADILGGLAPETVRYWRVHFFGVGNRHDRRYEYLKRGKENGQTTE